MVVLRRKNYHVLYPEYFDITVSRKEGRRVPLSRATTDSTLAKLVAACKKLNLEYIVEQDKSYPNRWWENRGRVLVKIDKSERKPKRQLLEEVGQKTRRLVSKKKEEKKKPIRSSTYKKKTTHSRKRSTYKKKKKKVKEQ